MVVAVALGACRDAEPSYGDVNGIWGKKLPGESESSGTPVDVGNVPDPTTTLKAAHEAGGGPAVDAVGACFGCHTEGGTAPAFAFGGRTVKTGTTTGAPGVIVVVEGVSPVKSDADGFFWATTGTVAGGSSTRINPGADEKVMATPLPAPPAGGNCISSNCHGGATPPISPKE